jgi:hypothetical protein
MATVDKPGRGTFDETVVTLSSPRRGHGLLGQTAQHNLCQRVHKGEHSLLLRMLARQFLSDPAERGRDSILGSIPTTQRLLDGVSDERRDRGEALFPGVVADSFERCLVKADGMLLHSTPNNKGLPKGSL